jgi:two-component system sensor histidine kinase KdpD
MVRWWSGTSGSRPAGRAVAMAVLATAAATGVALLLHPEPALGAVSVFLLGVVVAAVFGGAVGGITAAILCFASLNFFFTAPRHTLRVGNDEDVVALVAFFVVALVIGSLVSRLLAERTRATRNEREARVLGYVTSKARSGRTTEEMLGDIAETLVESLPLRGVRIAGRLGELDVDVARGLAPIADAARFPIGSSEGELVTLTAVPAGRALDASDRRLLESTARQLAVALERELLDAQIADARLTAEMNEARAALFSSVTHDLKTPLASIKAGVTSLLQPDVAMDDGQRRELLSTVLEETDRLNRLLGNLLELARVRAGALTPTKEPTAIDEVVESVLHRMRPLLQHVRLRTVLREAPDVDADPVQLDQVLTNLLENAARHSPDGGEVTVSVALWRSSVQVRVVDQGPGIPAEERERVFDAFYRGETSVRSGSGLGLAIARAIVLAHGGRIWVEGAPGGGTAVVFELPVIGPGPPVEAFPA